MSKPKLWNCAIEYKRPIITKPTATSAEQAATPAEPSATAAK